MRRRCRRKFLGIGLLALPANNNSQHHHHHPPASRTCSFPTHKLRLLKSGLTSAFDGATAGERRRGKSKRSYGTTFDGAREAAHDHAKTHESSSPVHVNMEGTASRSRKKLVRTEMGRASKTAPCCLCACSSFPFPHNSLSLSLTLLPYRAPDLRSDALFRFLPSAPRRAGVCRSDSRRRRQ